MPARQLPEIILSLFFYNYTDYLCYNFSDFPYNARLAKDCPAPFLIDLNPVTIYTVRLKISPN